MTPTMQPRNVSSRIVVAFDAPKRSFGTLEIACALASRLGASLEALFVEEEELMHVASLPFALEVDRVSGVARPLDTGLMARVLRTEAALLERLLARAASALPMSPKLRVVRGRYLAEALSVSASAEVTILHRARRSLDEARAGAARRGAPARRRRRPLWILYDGTQASARALHVTAELARTLGNELVVMIAAASREETTRLELEARARLADAGVEGRLIAVASTRAEDVRRAIGREGAALLVLGRDTARLEKYATSDWLEESATPVMLVA